MSYFILLMSNFVLSHYNEENFFFEMPHFVLLMFYFVLIMPHFVHNCLILSCFLFF